MPEIKIAVINKVPKIVGDIRCIVADNSDYTIRFTFDDMWEDGAKTVYFVRENGFAFPVGRTEDDTVTVPIQHESAMHSMLFVGVQQGDVKTSRPVEMRVVSAITDLITDDAVQPEPSMWEGVIRQIAAMQDELDGKVDGDELAAAVEDALTDAKESGEFNGPPGPPGSDYVLTEEDKKEIAEMVNASPAGAAPLYLTAEMDANGRYTIDGYTSAELTAAAREREVKLMLHSGVRVVLATLYPDIGFVGARYILGDGDGVISVNVLVSVLDRDDGIEGIWGNVIEAPGGGSGSGGILAAIAVGNVPCEDYATKYYRIPIGDEPEELTIDQLADAYTSSGLTLMLISDNGANGVVRAVLRPAPENPLLETLGFTGEYWIESDVPAEVVPVTPITATIKQDGTITIRLAETRPSVLHLIALGNLPGSTGIVHDTNGVTWTADSLPLAYAERPVELRVIQDPMGTPGSDIYVPPRDGVFKMYNVTGGGSDGTPRAVVFHGHYWGDDLAGWVPAVAVVGEDGRCAVADAAWDGYARKSEIPTSLPASDVYAWAKAPVKPTYTAGEVGALPASTKIPTKTSEITNDSGFITRLVTDLVNYYEKSDTYTRDEINALVSAIPKFTISVVSVLPTANISTTTVYLVGGGSGGDLYTEYIYVNGTWEILGSQRVDLTGYATESWVIGKLGDYLKTDDLQVAIDAALAQAKASGEFDGAPGEKGESGVYVGNEADMPAGTKVRVNPAGRVLKIPVVDDTLTMSGQSADAKVTGDRLDAISEAIGDKADGIIETATGEVLALSDSADAPLRGLVVYGKSTQDGTPTPDAPVDIVSVGGDDGVTTAKISGKNFFDPSGLLKASGWKEADGVYSGMNNALHDPFSYGSGGYMQISTGGRQVTFSFDFYTDEGDGTSKRTYISLNYEDGTKTSLAINANTKPKRYSVTSVAGKKHIVVGLSYGSPVMIHISNIQLEFGAAETAYEPYTAQTLPISTPDGLCGIPVTSGGNYTDANGQQWVCDEVDFVRGVRVQRICVEHMPKITSKSSIATAYTRFIVNISNTPLYSGESGQSTLKSVAISNRFVKFEGTYSEIANKPSSIMAYMSISNTPMCIMTFASVDIKTEDQANSIIGADGFDVYYILAKPIETPLSEAELTAYASLRTNYPNTTIYADDNAGLAVKYSADTKGYIDKKFAELATAIVNA